MNADLLKNTIHIHAEASQLSCGFRGHSFIPFCFGWHESGKLHINKTMCFKKSKLSMAFKYKFKNLES